MSPAQYRLTSAESWPEKPFMHSLIYSVEHMFLDVPGINKFPQTVVDNIYHPLLLDLALNDALESGLSTSALVHYLRHYPNYTQTDLLHAVVNVRCVIARYSQHIGVLRG